MLTSEETNQLTKIFEDLRNEDNLDHETILWLATRLQEINKESEKLHYMYDSLYLKITTENGGY